MFKYDPSAMNKRMRRELWRIGYPDQERIPLSAVTTKLLYLMTNHHDRVMAKTPVGIMKQRKGK